MASQTDTGATVARPLALLRTQSFCILTQGGIEGHGFTRLKIVKSTQLRLRIPQREMILER